MLSITQLRNVHEVLFGWRLSRTSDCRLPPDRRRPSLVSGMVQQLVVIFKMPSTGLLAVPQNNDFTIINSVNGTITHSSSTAVLSNSFYTGGNLHTVLDIGAGQTHTTTSLFLVGSGDSNQDVTVTSGTLNVGTILLIGSESFSDNSDVVITGANTVVHTSNAGINSGGVFVGVGGNNSTLTIHRAPSLWTRMWEPASSLSACKNPTMDC